MLRSTMIALHTRYFIGRTLKVELFTILTARWDLYSHRQNEDHGHSKFVSAFAANCTAA